MVKEIKSCYHKNESNQTFPSLHYNQFRAFICHCEYRLRETFNKYSVAKKASIDNKIKSRRP